MLGRFRPTVAAGRTAAQPSISVPHQSGAVPNWAATRKAAIASSRVFLAAVPAACLGHSLRLCTGRTPAAPVCAAGPESPASHRCRVPMHCHQPAVGRPPAVLAGS